MISDADAHDAVCVVPLPVQVGVPNGRRAVVSFGGLGGISGSQGAQVSRAMLAPIPAPTQAPAPAPGPAPQQDLVTPAPAPAPEEGLVSSLGPGLAPTGLLSVWSVLVRAWLGGVWDSVGHG